MPKNLTLMWDAPTPESEILNPHRDLVVTVSRGDQVMLSFPVALSKLARLRVTVAEDRFDDDDAPPPVRHVASIRVDLGSLQRGGSVRTAVCTCGWIGPERREFLLAADDASLHERGEL